MATHTTTSPPIRVLVADQSAFLREVLGQLIGTDPLLKLCATASALNDLIPLVTHSRPDVIVAGHEMFPCGVRPLLEHLLRRDIPVSRLIVCIPPTSPAAHDALQALADGATDILCADRTALCEQLGDLRTDLLRVIHAAARAARRTGVGALPNLPDEGEADLILMNLGCDGLPTLERVLPELSPQFPTPIIITHALPQACAQALATRLDGLGAISVHLSVQGMPLYPGTAYVLPARALARVRSLPGGPMRLELILCNGPDRGTGDPVVATPPRTLRLNVAGGSLLERNSPEVRGWNRPPMMHHAA